MREPRTPKAPVDPALPLWRRRTSEYLRGLDPNAHAVVRAMPALLTGRFRRPGLDREPPALLRMPRRRRWGRLCEKIELPPPLAFATSPPAISSVVLVPKADGSHELMVFTVPHASPAEVLKVSERLASIGILLDRRAPKLTVRLASPSEFSPAVAALAAVVCGDLPPPIAGPLDLTELVARAATPETRMLGLFAANAAQTFLEALPPTPWLPDGSISAALARWSGLDAARELVLVARTGASSPAQLALTADHLRRARALTFRRLPVGSRQALRSRLSQSLESRIPAVLRPKLLELLGRYPVTEVERDGHWECRVGETTLVKAKTLDQLRARAICESPTLATEGSEWRRVAALVSQGLARRAVVIVQPPFVKHLLVTIGPSLKPRAQRLQTLELTERCLATRSRGYALEVMTANGCDKPLASSVARLATLPNDGQEMGLQVGHRLLLARNGRTRNLPLAVALARPRRIRWLPEQAEWNAAFRVPPSSRFQSVQATVWPYGDTQAAMLSVDQSGRMFFERLERNRLDQTLHEIRDLLSPTMFSATVSPTLSALAGRRLSEDLPAVLFDVECDWPGRITLFFEGERFGWRAPLPWVAAAETVLSRWPPGVEGRVGVRALTWRRAPEDVSPLHVLTVRSWVLRRIGAQLQRLSRQLRAA